MRDKRTLTNFALYFSLSACTQTALKVSINVQFDCHGLVAVRKRLFVLLNIVFRIRKIVTDFGGRTMIS